VRVQFSRPMNANSFDDHVLVSYGPGVSEPPPKPKITYRPGNMSIDRGHYHPRGHGIPAGAHHVYDGRVI
jgi:hypothetical protein